MQSSGVMAIEAEPGMQALGSLLSGSQSQVGVFPVNWWEFFRQMPGFRNILLFVPLDITTVPRLPVLSSQLLGNVLTMSVVEPCTN